MEQDTKRALNKLSKDRYVWGNKISKHLAGILRKKRERNYIMKIQNKKGEIVGSSKGIAEEFRKYYKDLYSIRQKGIGESTKEERMEDFLKEVEVVKISKEERDLLDRPIEEVEILAALKSIPKGKSPGPDRFTSSYLVKFKQILIPRLSQYWNKLGTDCKMGGDALLAAITLIHKEDKNRELCSSYRPIS